MTVGSVTISFMALGPGITVGPFRIQSLIGKGGMGEVYSAVDTRLNRKVAIKVLAQEFGADGQRLQRFHLEAKTLAALSHPNILCIFEVGKEENTPYLVSELLEGDTLRERLNSGAISQRKTLEYALQIAHGFAAAHSKGIFHRDLKPENIFLTRAGQIKILDFGLVKLKSTATDDGQVTTIRTQPEGTYNTTQPGRVLGTPAYMSPEQVRGEPADHRSDIFAFGCVLYEMLSATRAFQRDTPVQSMNAVLSEEPPDQVNMPLLIDRLVHRCLEKQPHQRFQSASDGFRAGESLRIHIRHHTLAPGEAIHTPALVGTPRLEHDNSFVRFSGFLNHSEA
jgi:serine/threonine protein kinase